MTAGLAETVVADNFVPEENINVFIESHESLGFFYIYLLKMEKLLHYSYRTEIQ
jgi:hypothetical protein